MNVYPSIITIHWIALNFFTRLVFVIVVEAQLFPLLVQLLLLHQPTGLRRFLHPKNFSIVWNKNNESRWAPLVRLSSSSRGARDWLHSSPKFFSFGLQSDIKSSNFIWAMKSSWSSLGVKNSQRWLLMKNSDWFFFKKKITNFFLHENNKNLLEISLNLGISKWGRTLINSVRPRPTNLSLSFIQ